MRSFNRSFFSEFFDYEDDVRDFLDRYQIPEDELNENGLDSLRIIIKELHQIQDVIKETLRKTISLEEPMLMHGETGLIYSGTINIIKGDFGTFTSRVIETICSSLLSEHGVESSLGFSKSQLGPFQLLFVSTESNISDELPFDLQQIVTQANPDETLTRIFSFNGIKEFSWEIRFEVLRMIVRCKQNHPDYHLFIVLDKSSGFARDSDNPAHTKKLLNLLEYAANNCDCTFLCVIPENSSGEKTIGHLESELRKVSSTIIQVENVNRNTYPASLLEVKFIKPRSTETPVSIFYKYRNHARSLLLADPNDVEKSKAEEKASEDDFPFW